VSAWTTDKTTPPGRRPADNRPLPKLLPRSPTYLRAQLRIMKTPGGWYRTSSRQQNDSSRRPARLYGGGPARGRRQQTRRRGPGRAGGEPRRRATASQPARDSETNPLAPKDRLGRCVVDCENPANSSNEPSSDYLLGQSPTSLSPTSISSFHKSNQ
jgi:hypothetical protein